MRRADRETRELPEGDPIELRKLALEAMVDVRTLERYLAGEQLRSLSEERIRRMLLTRGLKHLLQKRAD